MTNTITDLDFEGATVSLDFGCDAISAIANAIEVLSEIQPPPDKLFNHTIKRLAGHAVYLADSMQNNIGCFIEQVKGAQQ